MKILEQNVIKWAEDRNIFEKSDLVRQKDKFLEEAIEFENEVLLLEDAIGIEGELILKGDEDVEAAKMELGDCLVTLTLCAKMLDTDLHNCLLMAYDKISKRKGVMVGGFYIKDEDIED